MASVIDLRLRRVPNLLVISGSILAVLFGLTGISDVSLTQMLMGGIVGLGVFILPYAIGQMGAGDVKLLGMCGFFLGPIPVLTAAVYAMLAGGLLAVCYLMCCQTMNARSKHQITLPYAVAITLGVLIVLAGY